MSGIEFYKIWEGWLTVNKLKVTVNKYISWTRIEIWFQYCPVKLENNDLAYRKSILIQAFQETGVSLFCIKICIEQKRPFIEIIVMFKEPGIIVF